MKLFGSFAPAVVLASGLFATPLLAQQPESRPYAVGNPLGVPVTPTDGRSFEVISANVRVFGAIFSAESCSYDPERGVIVVPNRGVPQSVQTNDAWVSFINHDGSVHTPRWIGVQGPAQRAALSPTLVLNSPSAATLLAVSCTLLTAMGARARASQALPSSAASTCAPARRPARRALKASPG